uniref:Sieve element occlusion N-terminal domain-containing protein n=1 Tax=Chenopodium quinoa TaxID=63459 RepID=A0A803LSD7_CHEQI
MATTHLSSDNVDVTEASKSKDQGLPQATGNERSMYVSLSNDEQKDKHDIVRQVEQLHKPDGSNVNAKPISLFVKRILEPAPASQTVEAASQDTPPSIYDSLPEFSDMPIIAGKIACKVVNDEVDSHTTTLSVLNVLQKFSWESKVALTVATFVLTFGDSGFNLTAESRTNVDKSPLFNEHEFEPTKSLIDAMVDATNCIADFENLPTSFFTSEDPKIKNANTDFLVAVYLVVRAVVTAAAHNITIFSTLNRMELFDWATKLKRISDDLKNMLPELTKLLEEDVDMEAYNLVKEAVLKEKHIDNMKVLNALISGKDNSQLYDCQVHRKVHLEVLKGQNVLLLISDLDIPTYPIQCMTKIASLDYSRYKVVWIPVDQTEAIDESKFSSQKEKMPGYSVNHPRMIKNAVI